MSKKQSRYQQMEWLMTCALVAAAGLFLLYLVFSAFGIVWLKVNFAILSILVSLACLAFLYVSNELLKRRSLWMSVGAGAVLLCLLFSLILNYPRPNPYKDSIPADTGSSSSLETT